MSAVYDTTGQSPEDILDNLRDWVDSLRDEEWVTVRIDAWAIRELAKREDDARNLKRLVKAMIGDAVKDALK